MTSKSGSGRARPSEATVDLAAFRSNVALARELAGERKVIAVVKADAYGHGALVIARAALDLGCASLAVLTVQEGLALREAAIAAPILVLAGARDDEEADTASQRHLTPVLHNEEGLARLGAAARRAGARVPVEVEVDTGMHRMGVPHDRAADFLERVGQQEGLELEGVFTHFARAEEADPAPSLAQITRFRAVPATARERGISPRLVHADNSAALLTGKVLAEALPEATAVRPGLMLYGVAPAPHLGTGLRPVMTFRAIVLAVHDLAAGDPVGYCATYRAPPGGTRIATLSVGYADGVPWTAGNRGHVWLAGARRAIVGRVSMDSIGVEVATGSAVEVGDEAIVFGRAPDGRGGIPVEDAARAAGALHYDLLVRVGARVPRIVRAD